MLRRSIPITAAVLLALALSAPGVVAQDEPASMAGHPLVGTWSLDDGGIATFHADGTLTGVSPDTGAAALGVWRPSGERAGEYTFTIAVPGGSALVRGTFEVTDDGSVTSTSTVEFVGAEGPSGQLGPYDTEGTRMTVEPMGEPVGPVPGAEMTPAADASPAA